MTSWPRIRNRQWRKLWQPRGATRARNVVAVQVLERFTSRVVSAVNVRTTGRRRLEVLFQLTPMDFGIARL
jgi:hypothetical protein